MLYNPVEAALATSSGEILQQVQKSALVRSTLTEWVTYFPMNKLASRFDSSTMCSVPPIVSPSALSSWFPGRGDAPRSCLPRSPLCLILSSCTASDPTSARRPVRRASSSPPLSLKSVSPVIGAASERAVGWACKWAKAISRRRAWCVAEASCEVGAVGKEKSADESTWHNSTAKHAADSVLGTLLSRLASFGSKDGLRK